MKKILLLTVMLAIMHGAFAQVKIGYNAAGAVNAGAILHLNNDTSAASAPNQWKGVLLPYVDFTQNSFTDSSTWGIAGTATNGMVVYNIGNRTSGGFDGHGVYVWGDSAWMPIKRKAVTATVVTTGCTDPSATAGSTGCVAFTYQGQKVTYPTVRALDGKIWIQQSLGASEVATAITDAAAYGDLFQWGRWDDSAQRRTSTTAQVTTLTVGNNPLGLGVGSSKFYIGTNPVFWWTGGDSTNTWSVGLPASPVNGKDPCGALGWGWHIPAESEWANVVTSESITNLATAFSSNLKMTGGTDRNLASGLIPGGSVPSIQSQYWSSTPAISGTSGAQAYYLYITTSAATPASVITRGYGMSVRCVKN